MAMGHSVEGRYPFLDFRLVEFCNQLPDRFKLRGLTEKYLLKKLGEKWLPQEIWKRPKRPYRAPIHRSFFNRAAPDYVRDLLSATAVKRTSLFNPVAVEQLIRKIGRGGRLGETDEMALVGILSTQLLHHQFVSDFKVARALDGGERVKICMGTAKGSGHKQSEPVLQL